MKTVAPFVHVHDYDTVNIEGSDRGDLKMLNVEVFRLPMESPWTESTYLATNAAKDALVHFAKKPFVFGELGNPIDRLKHASNRLYAIHEIRLDRAVVKFTNMRVEHLDQDGIDVSSLYADVEVPNTLFGRMVSDHILKGGAFRFLLRSLTMCSFSNNTERRIVEIITFDLGIFDIDTLTPDQYKTAERFNELRRRVNLKNVTVVVDPNEYTPRPFSSTADGIYPVHLGESKNPYYGKGALKMTLSKPRKAIEQTSLPYATAEEAEDALAGIKLIPGFIKGHVNYTTRCTVTYHELYPEPKEGEGDWKLYERQRLVTLDRPEEGE